MPAPTAAPIAKKITRNGMFMLGSAPNIPAVLVVMLVVVAVWVMF
jgi:hypothetical protein